MATTRERNKKRKLRKRMESELEKQATQVHMWRKFDYMTYARKVKR